MLTTLKIKEITFLVLERFHKKILTSKKNRNMHKDIVASLKY